MSWPEALRGGWAVVNSHKGPNGTPQPSSDVTCVGTRDRLRGASPTNGLWRRSTRSTPGAGLTAGANRTTRARRCGEGVQASTGCPRRGACVMQESAHVGGSHREGGAHGPPWSWTYAPGGAGRAGPSPLAGERSALKGACCVREGPAGKAHRDAPASRWLLAGRLPHISENAKPRRPCCNGCRGPSILPPRRGRQPSREGAPPSRRPIPAPVPLFSGAQPVAECITAGTGERNGGGAGAAPRPGQRSANARRSARTGPGLRSPDRARSHSPRAAVSLQRVCASRTPLFLYT
jgi:hypothetical protein